MQTNRSGSQEFAIRLINESNFLLSGRLGTRTPDPLCVKEML